MPYIRAFRVVSGLRNYRDKYPDHIREEKHAYEGLGGQATPYRIFHPVKAPKSIIIVYPGGSPKQEDHPAMRTLGHAMADSGSLVFIPRIPPLQIMEISEAIMEWYSQFYLWLKKQPQWSKLPVAVIGISFGGISVLKSLNKGTIKHNPPKSVIVFGTGYDFFGVVDFLFTGRIEYNGEVRQLEVEPWGIVGFFHNYIKYIDPGYDISPIQSVLATAVKQDHEGVKTQIANLSGKVKEISEAIIHGQQTDDVMHLYRLIKTEIPEKVNAFSPRYWCEDIQEKVFVIHGTDDKLAPFTESIKLAEKLPNSELLISRAMEHRSIGGGGGILFKITEAFRIIKFFHRFIRFTEVSL